MGLFGRNVSNTNYVNRTSTGAEAWKAMGKILAPDTSESTKAMAAEQEAKRQEKAAKAANEAEKLRKVDEITLGGTADEIETGLNNLIVLYKAQPKSLIASKAEKSLKAAIVEKVEFGVLKLQKIDPDSAAFFQNKLDEITKKKK